MTEAGAHYRLGLIVPSSNTTMETELPLLFGRRQEARPEETFSFHSSRMRMRKVTPEELRAMNSQTERSATELADIRPDAVASACLVAIMAQGRGHHLEVERQISAVLDDEGASAPVVTSAGALIAALSHLGAERIAVVTPYMKPLTQLVCDYIEDAGCDVHDSCSLEVADNRAVGRLDQGLLPGHVASLDLTGCDAVVASACVQMPSLRALDEIEERTGLPTLSAASATAWQLMRELELEPLAAGGGALLRGHAQV